VCVKMRKSLAARFESSQDRDDAAVALDEAGIDNDFRDWLDLTRLLSARLAAVLAAYNAYYAAEERQMRSGANDNAELIALAADVFGYEEASFRLTRRKGLDKQFLCEIIRILSLDSMRYTYRRGLFEFHCSMLEGSPGPVGDSIIAQLIACARNIMKDRDMGRMLAMWQDAHGELTQQMSIHGTFNSKHGSPNVLQGSGRLDSTNSVNGKGSRRGIARRMLSSLHIPWTMERVAEIVPLNRSRPPDHEADFLMLGNVEEVLGRIYGIRLDEPEKEGWDDTDGA